jgi:hypothetical protein
VPKFSFFSAAALLHLAGPAAPQRLSFSLDGFGWHASAMAQVVDRLSDRDPEREALEAVETGDYRPMGLFQVDVAGAHVVARGLTCAGGLFRYREQFGSSRNEKAARSFVESYNQALTTQATARGIDVCALAKKQEVPVRLNAPMPPRNRAADAPR